MGLIATKKKSLSIPPLEPDVYIGVCYAVIDLGVQYNEKYKKSEEKVLIMWEITDETVEIDGENKPRIISCEYTLSISGKSKLAGTLKSWLGIDTDEIEDFNIGELLLKACQMDITVKENNGVQRNYISTIMKLAKGQKAHTPEETFIFNMDDESTHSVLDKLPEWVREKINKSKSVTRELDIPESKEEPGKFKADF